MKTIKSLACLTLALALCLSLANVSAFAAEEALEPITISMATWNTPVLSTSSDDFTKPDGKYYDERWTILADKFNVKLEFIPLEYNTHQEKLRVMINGDDMPDVMLSTLGATEYRAYVEDELLQLLPAGYEANYPNIKAQLDLIMQRDAYTVDGQYYAIPRALESVEPYVDYVSSVYYRKDLAKDANVEIKDYYTVQELYDMFVAVKAKNPDMIMYNNIWPDNIIQLGLVQAVPDISNTAFCFDEEKGEYVWIWADKNLVKGLDWFKKFYDAGFLETEFFNMPFYEARNQFNNNQLFCCFDGFDVLFYDQMRTNYLASNAGAPVDDIIGYAYLLDEEGNMQARQAGNSWSEYIFRHDIDQKVLDRFLLIYNWMLSDEGIMFNRYGIEGKHYKMEDGKIVNLRAIDAQTGKPAPFNKDPEHANDSTDVLFCGAMADSKANNINPLYSDAAKAAVDHFWTLRKGFTPLRVQKFDLGLAIFQGDFYSKYSLKPVDAIYKIIFEEKPENVGAAWQKYLDENAAQINNILQELNEGIKR